MCFTSGRSSGHSTPPSFSRIVVSDVKRNGNAGFLTVLSSPANNTQTELIATPEYLEKKQKNAHEFNKAWKHTFGLDRSEMIPLAGQPVSQSSTLATTNSKRPSRSQFRHHSAGVNIPLQDVRGVERADDAVTRRPTDGEGPKFSVALPDASNTKKM